MRGRNDVILSHPETGMPTHFRLAEFENAEGLAMVHPKVLVALEHVRDRLWQYQGEEVMIIIHDGVRTQADNERLAARLGWTDKGGLVSRDSKHLARYGGIAVDITAKTKSRRQIVPQDLLGRVCVQYFDFVKYDYADGHVHADMRGLLNQ